MTFPGCGCIILQYIQTFCECSSPPRFQNSCSFSLPLKKVVSSIFPLPLQQTWLGDLRCCTIPQGFSIPCPFLLNCSFTEKCLLAIHLDYPPVCCDDYYILVSFRSYLQRDFLILCSFNHCAHAFYPSWSDSVLLVRTLIPISNHIFICSFSKRPLVPNTLPAT